MAFDIHTIDVAAGSNINRLDRVITFFQNAIPNLGGSAGALVTTAVTFVGELPATYSVFASTSLQNASVAIQGKTATGFNVVLTPVPVATATIAAGTFDVLVVT